MKFAISDKRNGKIRAIIDGSVQQAIAQLSDNETYTIMTDGNDSTHYIDRNGLPTKKPLSPTPYHVFNYDTKEWEDHRTTETEWQLIRENRDKLLSMSDWVVIKASDMGTAIPSNWRTYRQALRDMTNQSDPFSVIWPKSPT